LKFALGNSMVQVFPVLGNHDTWPVNVEDFSSQNSNYEINQLNTTWTGSYWLNETEMSQFLEFGYYSRPLSFSTHERDNIPLPNVTVIGMNM